MLLFEPKQCYITAETDDFFVVSKCPACEQGGLLYKIKDEFNAWDDLLKCGHCETIFNYGK